MGRERPTDRAVLAQIPAARARAARLRATVPTVQAVSYDRHTARVRVGLSSGAELAVPVRAIPQLARASARDRAAVVVNAAGLGVSWPALDLDVSVAGLLHLVCGPRALMQAAGAAMGGVRSPAKAEAARRNGKKGGRPKRVSTTGLR